MNNKTSGMNDAKRLLSSIETVTVMHYHLEEYRIRSLAALGLALTTSVVALLSMLVAAL